MAIALNLPALKRQRLPLPVLAVVLLVHALLLLLATRASIRLDRRPALEERPPLLTWLLDRKPTAKAQAAPPLARPAAAITSTQPTRSEPQAITLPAATTEAPAAPPLAAEPAREAPPPPLNLSLPRGASAAWRQRNPALDDARANSPRRTLETLVAQALGGDPDGPITEDHFPDGSVRFRRGSQCVIAHPNRAQDLNPYNSSVLPKPRLVEGC